MTLNSGKTNSVGQWAYHHENKPEPSDADKKLKHSAGWILATITRYTGRKRSYQKPEEQVQAPPRAPIQTPSDSAFLSRGPTVVLGQARFIAAAEQRAEISLYLIWRN